MSSRISKIKTSGDYPPQPINQTQSIDETPSSIIKSNLEQSQILKSKTKPKAEKNSRVSKVQRISKIGGQIHRTQRISLQQVQERNNYFQNSIITTKCCQCGNMTQAKAEHVPGCLTFTACVVLIPFGMGSCFLPFFIKGCLDIQQKCLDCNHTKRLRRASLCRG